jgi:hypothetical protein
MHLVPGHDGKLIARAKMLETLAPPGGGENRINTLLNTGTSRGGMAVDSVRFGD